MRRALNGLPRYIVTGQVAKHRLFQWLDASILPDDKLISVASADALHLGVLSSAVHVTWALAAGGLLEDRPVYSKSTCFETFPFPDLDSGLTPELAGRIRSLAEQIDSHRKTQQASHPDLTMTSMYNVLDKLRAGEALTSKEQSINSKGLLSVLRSLHDDLDAAVLAAYGWSDLTLPTDADELLSRLVDLNQRRSSEEAAGQVRWLRPDLQQHAQGGAQASLAGVTPEQEEEEGSASPTAAVPVVSRRAWPSGIPEQIKAVADVLGAGSRPMELEDIAGHFTARGRWRERLPTILETLEALGRVRRLGESSWGGPAL